jgi:hypothetical protein
MGRTKLAFVYGSGSQGRFMARVASLEVFLACLYCSSNLGCLLEPKGVTVQTRNTLRECLLGRTQRPLLFKNARGEIKSPLYFDRPHGWGVRDIRIWSGYEMPIVKMLIF